MKGYINRRQKVNAKGCTFEDMNI